jgi:hypothetical protein
MGVGAAVKDEFLRGGRGIEKKEKGNKKCPLRETPRNFFENFQSLH